MYEIIITIITNFFRIFILKRFIELFFNNKKIKRKLKIIVYIFFYLITTINHLIFHLPTINIITNLIGIYLITQIYTASQQKKILITFLCYSINMICDIFSVFIFMEYRIGENYNYISIFITVILIMICEIIIEKIVNKEDRKDVESLYWKILLLVPICSIIILYYILTQNLRNRLLVIIICVGILFINIIIFYLYNAIVDTCIKLQENAFFKRQTEIYSNQLEITIQSESKIRSLHHDMKNHMQEIYNMVQNNQYNEVLSYIDKMYKFVENPKEHSYSGNKEIDGILNYMIGQNREKLNIDINICIPEQLDIQAFDANVILGNLLQNAIDAAILSKERILKIFINFEMGILFINISNSYLGKIIEKNSKFMTSKGDQEGHGYGLENVKKILETYNGTMDISYSNLFEVRIMLYIMI